MALEFTAAEILKLVFGAVEQLRQKIEFIILINERSPLTKHAPTLKSDRFLVCLLELNTFPRRERSLPPHQLSQSPPHRIR